MGYLSLYLRLTCSKAPYNVLHTCTGLVEVISGVEIEADPLIVDARVVTGRGVTLLSSARLVGALSRAAPADELEAHRVPIQVVTANKHKKHVITFFVKNGGFLVF